jgi:hypothetical protein
MPGPEVSHKCSRRSPVVPAHAVAQVTGAHPGQLSQSAHSSLKVFLRPHRPARGDEPSRAQTLGRGGGFGQQLEDWNKTLFKQAGLAPFGSTVTWSQVLNAAQKISALGHGIYGFEYAGSEKWSMLYNNIGPLVFQAGGQFVNRSATKAFATSASVERAVSYWDQLAKYAPASDITEQNQSVPEDAFAMNQAGMFYNGFWDIGGMISVNPKVQFGATEMKDVSVDSNTGGWILSVPSFTPSSKMKAIEEFYSYVFAPQNEIDLTGIMPAVKAATPLDKAIEGPQYQIFWNILKEHAQQPVPLTANMYQEGIDILNAVEATELGHSIPSEMSTLQSQLQSLLQ